jgi:hypothetical protein
MGSASPIIAPPHLSSSAPTQSPITSIRSSRSWYRAREPSTPSRGLSCLATLGRLLSNSIYVCTVLALTGLYFVVTGVQFWATDFLITVIHGDVNTVRYTRI